MTAHRYASLKSKAAQMIEDGTVVCPACEGCGLVFHASQVDSAHVDCPACSATGRVMAPRVASIPEFDAILGEPLRERKLAHLRDCIAEAEREHSPEEVAAAAEHLADSRSNR